jgi:tRNA threonylcarbamoyl adenosine modification protein YeaZ
VTGTLAIDTASDVIAVGFVGGATEAPRIIAVDGERNHSQILLKLIDEVIDHDRASIESIVVVRGPGSYAGLRVGIATAQALGLALGVPVSGVGTLEAVAEAAGQPPTLNAIHPAGRGEYAVQSFSAGKAAGAVRAYRSDSLPGGALAGEGAGESGGQEIGSRERCLAALELVQRREAGPAEALYLREPHITLSRKQPVSPAG